MKFGRAPEAYPGMRYTMRGHRVSWCSQAQRLGKKPGPCQLQGAVPWVEGRRERQGAAGVIARGICISMTATAAPRKSPEHGNFQAAGCSPGPAWFDGRRGGSPKLLAPACAAPAPACAMAAHVDCAGLQLRHAPPLLPLGAFCWQPPPRWRHPNCALLCCPAPVALVQVPLLNLPLQRPWSLHGYPS